MCLVSADVLGNARVRLLERTQCLCRKADCDLLRFHTAIMARTVPFVTNRAPLEHEVERRQERRGRGTLELHQQIVAIEPVLRVERFVREVELRGEELRVTPLRLDVD